MKRAFCVAAFSFCIAACGSSPPMPPASNLAPDEIPLVVDQRCPGGPTCADQGDGKLYVGYARRDMTPLVEPFVDLNNNGLRDANEPFTDLDGNGVFDPVWLAGRDNGRQAFGVHDPTWLRCYVIKQNETTVAHCVVDAIGYFQDEEAQIRADLDPSLGVDLLMMGATHDHQAKDTTGLWGPDLTTTGYDAAYMARIRAGAVDAIGEALAHARPAKMAIASIATEDPDRDMQHYVSDTRDPVIIDDRLHLIQFDGEDGVPIVTVVNWAAHPDSLGSGNRYVSSDFVHYLREEVAAGTGSDVVFVNGAQGGQIGPGIIQPLRPDGTTQPTSHDFQFIDVWGQEIAREALKAFDARQMVDNPRLAFVHTTVDVHVENVAYQVAARLGMIHKSWFGFDPHVPLTDPANAPLTRTEIAYLTLGPASIVTCPGELLPELFVGGYDGSHSGKYRIVDETQPNAPDLSKAPAPPYLVDLMDGPVEHHMLFGLTLDFLGYVVPRYNFVLDPDAPYISRAPGDHYEETNSIGPRAEPEIVGTMRQLIRHGTAKP